MCSCSYVGLVLVFLFICRFGSCTVLCRFGSRVLVNVINAHSCVLVLCRFASCVLVL